MRLKGKSGFLTRLHNLSVPWRTGAPRLCSFFICSALSMLSLSPCVRSHTLLVIEDIIHSFYKAIHSNMLVGPRTVAS